MAKIIVSLLLAILIIFSAYLLWQRQPKDKIPESTTSVSATQEAKESEVPKLVENPLDNSIQKETIIKFNGHLQPSTYLAIYTNDNQYIIKTDNTGKYEKGLTFSKGLNLISVQAFNPDLNTDKNQNLTIYTSDKPVGSSVFAGTVKTIFDTVITIATSNGDKSAKTAKSSQINTPKDEKAEATSTAEDLVRVGDFVIALGNLKGADNQDTQNLEVIRENKPNNTESIAAVKTSSTVNQNLLSAVNKNGASQQFNLDKNTGISNDDKEATGKDITKDKNAFIFYHTESGKNIADLIYLLP